VSPIRRPILEEEGTGESPASDQRRSAFPRGQELVCLLAPLASTELLDRWIFLFVYLRKIFHDHVPEHKFFIKRKVFKKSGGVAPLLKIN
jgi:hypothetical protein